MASIYDLDVRAPEARDLRCANIGGGESNRQWFAVLPAYFPRLQEAHGGWVELLL